MEGKTTVVISGYYGFDNIGDEAVLYAIIGALRMQLPEVEIIVLSNAPQKTKTIYQVQSINRWKIKEVIQAIKKSDLLISGGGSLLQDTTSNKTIPYYLAIVKIAEWLKKPVVFYSQGIGPVNKGFNKWLIKTISKKVNHIFVREEGSKNTLLEMKVNTDITVAIDPVLGLTPKKEVVEKVKKSMGDKKAIGIYIRPWQNTQEIVESLVSPLKAMIEQGYDVYLVPMYYQEDNAVAKMLHKRLGEKSKLLDRELTIEETIAYTANFEWIIGMRLHSLIMATAVNVPMVALSYDPKVKDFVEELKIKHCIDTEGINKEIVMHEINALLNQFSEEKMQLEESYQEKIKKVYLPALYIKELLK